MAKKDQQLVDDNTAIRQSFSAQCVNVRIDAELLALVGVHPDDPVEQDSAIIRAMIAQKLANLKL